MYLQGTRVVPVPPFAAHADSGVLVACSVDGALAVTFGRRGLLRGLTIINLIGSICHRETNLKVFSLSGYYCTVSEGTPPTTKRAEQFRSSSFTVSKSAVVSLSTFLATATDTLQSSVFQAESRHRMRKLVPAGVQSGEPL